MCAGGAQGRIGASKDARSGDRGFGDGHAIDLGRHSLVRFAVEIDDIAVVIPRGARKAHFRSRDIGDLALPHQLGNGFLKLGAMSNLNHRFDTPSWAYRACV